MPSSAPGLPVASSRMARASRSGRSSITRRGSSEPILSAPSALSAGRHQMVRSNSVTFAKLSGSMAHTCAVTTSLFGPSG
jgi:hypothetical protein